MICFWLLRFLSPCLAWKNLVLLESSRVSRSCFWWFWFLLEHLKSKDISLKLKELSAVVKIKMMQKERKAWPGCGCWIWGSCRKLWVALGEADSALSPCADGPEPLFSLRFLWSLAWFEYRIFYLQGGDTSVFPQCSAQPAAEHFRSEMDFRLCGWFPPPLCFQVSK